ncbi:hypothetical protein [Nitrosomonas sp. Is79A3]
MKSSTRYTLAQAFSQLDRIEGAEFGQLTQQHSLYQSGKQG